MRRFPRCDLSRSAKYAHFIYLVSSGTVAMVPVADVPSSPPTSRHLLWPSRLSRLCAWGFPQPPGLALFVHHPWMNAPEQTSMSDPQELMGAHFSPFPLGELTLRCKFYTESQSAPLPTVVTWLTTHSWLTFFPFLFPFLHPYSCFLGSPPRWTLTLKSFLVSGPASWQPKLRHSFISGKKIL